MQGRPGQASRALGRKNHLSLSLTLPRGATKVDGAMGRSDVNVLGGDVSFFGFLAILLLRCSPLAMLVPWVDIPAWEALDVKAQSRRICGFVW